MESRPKASAWNRPATSSNSPGHKVEARQETGLPLNVWPEFPSSSSLEQSPSAAVSRNNTEAEYSTPSKSVDRGVPQKYGGSPNPRAKQPSSENRPPRGEGVFTRGNGFKNAHPLEPPISQHKKAAARSDTPASSSQNRASSLQQQIVILRRLPSRFYDLASLQAAMRDDAEATLAYIQSLLIENEELKCKLDATNEQLEFEKVHLEKTVEVYEELQSIARAKEYVLMQQIQRLNVSENSPKSPLSEPITCIEVGEEEGLSLLQGGPSGESPKLDPNAQAFVPFASSSSSGSQNQGSMNHTLPSPAPTPQASTLPTSQDARVSSITNTGPLREPLTVDTSAPLSPSILDAVIKSIPPLFRAVCPFSLTGTLCPVSGCQMKRLCLKFNDPSGRNTCQSKNGCRHVHEHPTCLGEAEGTGCEFASESAKRAQKDTKGKGKINEADTARKNHFKGMVHQNQCGSEEWRLRLVMFGLRKAHKEGLFKY